MGNGFCLGIPLAEVNLGELGEIGVNWRLPQKIAAIRGSSGGGYFGGAGVVVKCASQKIAAIRGSSGNSGYFGGAGVVVKCA